MVDEEHVMPSKSDNIEIIIYDKADELSNNFLNHYLKGIKLGCWKYQCRVVILSLTVFTYFITNVIK